MIMCDDKTLLQSTIKKPDSGLSPITSVLPEHLFYISNIFSEASHLLLCLKPLLLWEMYPTGIFIAPFEEPCSLRANPHSRRAAAAQFHSFKQLCSRWPTPVLSSCLKMNEVWVMTSNYFHLFWSGAVTFYYWRCCVLGGLTAKDGQQIRAVWSVWSYFSLIQLIHVETSQLKACSIAFVFIKNIYLALL